MLRPMPRPRLLVIQHNLDDHLNELGGPLVDAGLEIDPWFTQGRPEPPRDASEYDGVVSLGAIAGVADEDDHPWMSAERAVLEKALGDGAPTLGVCFGAQMLASMAGARVHRAARAEIGWTQVHMEPAASDDPVLCSLGARPHVFQFHYDTFEDPPGGEILGRTGDDNQVLRIGDRAWGLQFHVEVSPGAIYSWAGTYRAEMLEDGVDLDALFAETADRWTHYRSVARSLATAFAHEVARFAADR